jgi:hypothetical protein
MLPRPFATRVAPYPHGVLGPDDPPPPGARRQAPVRRRIPLAARSKDAIRAAIHRRHQLASRCRIGWDEFVAFPAKLVVAGHKGERHIRWVAVGDAAQLHPPEHVDAIRNALDQQGGFLPYVFGVDPGLARPEAMRAALGRYTRGLAAHQADRIVE